MDQIIKYVEDPAWWFSAFFIAIFASVVAGFAKDKLEEILGHISRRAKERHERKLLERERLMEAFAANEGFLILSMVRATGAMLLSLSTIILFVLSPMWVELIDVWCEALPADPTCRFGGRFISAFSAVSFGFLAAVSSYLAVSRAKVTMRGYAAYRLKRGLPIVR